MSSFLHATDLGSDTDDDDYVPDEKETQGLSEEEDNQEGEEKEEGKKKKKKTKSVVKRGPLQDEAEVKENEERKKEFEKEKVEMKEEEEKKKIDDLWADFKKDTDSKPKPSRSGTGLGSLGSMKPSTSTSTSASTSKEQPKSIVSSIFDTDKPLAVSKPVEKKPVSIISSIFDSIDSSSAPAKKEEKKEEEVKEEDSSKLKIKQIFDFAGESVEITKEVDKDSREGKKFLKKQEDEAEEEERAKKRPGGLASIMNVISGKKQKLGCLDKSKLDWNKFVSEEGIKEELETHNKGKDGFVEKQQFLDRADMRRFEIEKEAREKTRKTLNR